VSTRRVLQLGYLEPPPAAAREYGASAPWRSQTEEDALPPGATMSHGAYAPARLTYSPDGQNLKSSGYGPALDPISLEAEDWRSTRVEGAPRCLCKTSWSGKDTSGIVKRYPGGGCHNPDQDPTPWCFTEMGSNGQPCGNFFPNDPEQDPWTYCVDHCQAGRGVGEVHRIGCPVQVSQSPRHLLIARRSRCSTATQSVGRGGARADVRHTCLHACRRGGGHDRRFCAALPIRSRSKPRSGPPSTASCPRTARGSSSGTRAASASPEHHDQKELWTD
jgi:hypothetical protein